MLNGFICLSVHTRYVDHTGNKFLAFDGGQESHSTPCNPVVVSRDAYDAYMSCWRIVLDFEFV